MPLRHSTLARPLVAMVMVAASSLYAIAQQPPTPSRVRGTIESVDGDVLAVKSRSGEDVKLHMTADVRVVGITKISLSDIKVGSFIGTTTVPGPDGMPTAIEVHVFPENLRGTGEGSRPYDLRPNSTMTNATVAESVVGNDGHTLRGPQGTGEPSPRPARLGLVDQHVQVAPVLHRRTPVGVEDLVQVRGHWPSA